MVSRGRDGNRFSLQRLPPGGIPERARPCLCVVHRQETVAEADAQRYGPRLLVDQSSQGIHPALRRDRPPAVVATEGETADPSAPPDFLSRVVASVNSMWFSLRRTTCVVPVRAV